MYWIVTADGSYKFTTAQHQEMVGLCDYVGFDSGLEMQKHLYSLPLDYCVYWCINDKSFDDIVIQMKPILVEREGFIKAQINGEDDADYIRRHNGLLDKHVINYKMANVGWN